MKRSEVNEQYKWRLEDIYETDEAWEKEFKECSASVKKMSSYKGKLASRRQLLACLNYTDEIEIKLAKLYCYARMRRDENSVIDKFVSMSERAEGIEMAYMSACAFLSPELSKLSDEYLDEVSALVEFRALFVYA